MCFHCPLKKKLSNMLILNEKIINFNKYFCQRDMPENVGEDADEADMEMPKIYEPVNILISF